MAWTEGFPINFSVDGDTTAEAISKFINEISAMYTLLNRVRSLDAGAVAPSDPEADAVWIDTSATDFVLKYYTGSAWANVMTVNSIEGLSTDLTAITDAIALRATLADPALTGVPTAPTATTGTNTTQISSTAFVQQEIAGDIEATDYASSTVGGTVKVRLSGTVLYIRNDGTDA